MNRLAVINVVGLTEALLGGHTPRLAEFRRRGALARIAPAFPAVTCTAQASYLTGLTPARHGIVGNGWYHRELAEIHFWKQSNHLVQAPKIWDALRAQSGFGPQPLSIANCFWWFNMYSSVDYALTPRPIYRANGGKVFDIYSWPSALRPEIKRELGEFPFFGFWGPAAGLKTPQGAADCASRWIAEAAKWMENKFAPALNLVYLPHLDYNLQRHGVLPSSRPALQPCGGRAFSLPSSDGERGRCLEVHPADSSATAWRRQNAAVDSAAPLPGSSRLPPTPVAGREINPVIIPDLRGIDDLAGDLIQFFEARGVRVVLLSEYGLTNVNTPVHLNRIFRAQGWLAVRDELGLEVLDAGASRVFAVADHQVAHVYLNDRALEHPVRELLEKTPGVDQVLGGAEKSAAGVAHARAGDFIVVAAEHAWFTYYYWLEEARAPDFARTVDIHRKPGYDPVELFLDPCLPLPQLKIAWRLLQKKLGLRMLMDVVPLDAALVKGSHGRRPADQRDWPVFLTGQPRLLAANQIESTDVFQILLRHLTD